MHLSRLTLLFAVSVLAACSESTDPATDVASAPEAATPAETAAAETPVVTNEPEEPAMRVYTGFKNPEDIVVLPDNNTLLISEMGEFMTDAPGRLRLFDITDKTLDFPNMVNGDGGENWGDASCPAPDVFTFSPHGIDLSTRADGKTQLLVVNHGGRESVEFYEVSASENGWDLTWRGCALPPEDPFINDVVAVGDGGFLVTHMWNKSTPFEKVAEQLMAGEKIGWVWQWQPGAGFSKLANSTEMMPNGITASPDGKFAFVNIYMGNKTIKLDLQTGEKVGEFEVRQPDNISMGQDGYLWVASHQHDPINQTCTEVKEGPCLLPFNVVRANPDTLETEVVLSHEGEPMGYTTVATQFGDQVFLGSAHGDRIAILPLK